MLKAFGRHSRFLGGLCRKLGLTMLISLRIIFLAGILLMQAWLVWVFISRQVSYWSDVMQSRTTKAGKKKEIKKKSKEQKKTAVGKESDDEIPALANGKKKFQ